MNALRRLGNVPQLRTLFAAGYAGFASFEPFAAEIAWPANHHHAC